MPRDFNQIAAALVRKDEPESPPDPDTRKSGGGGLVQAGGA
jgi:hypothetical protein